MIWKEILYKLETTHNWEFGVEFMQDVLSKNQNVMDAHIYMNYLLMNIITNENIKYNPAKYEDYEELIQYYFNKSYEKYSENAEFLFYTAQTAFLFEPYFGIFFQDAKAMLQKAAELEPNNPLYQIANISERSYIDVEERKNSKAFANLILKNNSPIKKLLLKKGTLGRHILNIITEWANDMITGKYHEQT